MYHLIIKSLVSSKLSRRIPIFTLLSLCIHARFTSVRSIRDEVIMVLKFLIRSIYNLYTYFKSSHWHIRFKVKAIQCNEIQNIS